jgi:hypothetical protein
MDKAEVKGFQSPWSGMKIARPHWIEKVNVIAVNAHTSLTDRSDVSFLKDLVTDPKDKKVAELMAGNMILGRGWLAPPVSQQTVLRRYAWRSKDRSPTPKPWPARSSAK